MSDLKSPPPQIVPRVPIDPDPDPPPPKSISPTGFLWSNLFGDTDSSIAQTSSISYLPDGTPVVIAPPSVILRASSNWEGHLLCRFMGEPPSPAKFFNDLNRVWGKHGDISVRRFSSGTFLVFVPSASTRKWILQTGLWSSGTVSFVVSEWSTTQSLAPPPKLTSATTVLTIRQIPPQLWSQEAVARIAGGVAKLIPGTRASLPLSSLGTATIRAIVPLGATLPPSVMVKDIHGDSVIVSIDYGRLPYLCSNCNSFGHQKHRCPVSPSVTKPISPKSKSKSPKIAESRLTPDQVSIPQQSSIITERDDASQKSTILQSTTIAPETSDHSMDVDSKDSGEKILEDTSETLLPSTLSLPIADESRQVSSSPSLVSSEMVHSESLVAKCDVNSLNPSMLKSSAQDPEIIVQNMDLDSKVDEVVVLKDDEIVAGCPSSSVSELPSLHVSPALVQPSLPNSTSQIQSQVDSDLLIISPLDNETDTRTTDDTLGHSSPHSEVNTDQTIYSNIPAKFDLSLPLNTAHDPGSVTASKGHLMSKRGSTRDSKKNKDLHNSLRCIQVKHPYKLKGVVEKSRRKASHACVPKDEDVHECLMEMQSDMKNTLHFEAVNAIKVLRKLESEGCSKETT